MFTVLVCGGRDYNDKAKVFETLDSIHGRSTIDVLVQGGARGADLLGARWTFFTAPPVEMHEYRADWGKYGKRAGFVRNQTMLNSENVNLVVAFPGGNGTADMVARAKRANIPVVEIK